VCTRVNDADGKKLSVSQRAVFAAKQAPVEVHDSLSKAQKHFWPLSEPVGGVHNITIGLLIGWEREIPLQGFHSPFFTSLRIALGAFGWPFQIVNPC